MSIFAAGLPVFNQGFRAHQTVNQTINPNTFTKLNFHVEDYDLASEFNLAVDRFTPSKNGYYIFVGAGRIKNLGANKKIIVSLFLNGARNSEGRTVTAVTDYIGVFVSDILQLTTSDFVELFIFQNSGILTTAGNEIAPSFFAGWRLR